MERSDGSWDVQKVQPAVQLCLTWEGGAQGSTRAGSKLEHLLSLRARGDGHPLMTLCDLSALVERGRSKLCIGLSASDVVFSILVSTVPGGNHHYSCFIDEKTEV